MISIIKAGVAGLAFALLASSDALAQYPGGPMDQIGGGIQRQIELQQQGDQDAYDAGMSAYNMMQQRRLYGLPVPDGPPLGYQQRSNCQAVYDPVRQQTYIACD